MTAKRFLPFNCIKLHDGNELFLGLPTTIYRQNACFCRFRPYMGVETGQFYKNKGYRCTPLFLGRTWGNVGAVTRLWRAYPHIWGSNGAKRGEIGCLPPTYGGVKYRRKQAF